MEKLLTIAEAAAKLGVKPQTLYLWVAQKRICHRKIGRLVRFRECDLEEFVDQHRQPVEGEEEHDEHLQTRGSVVVPLHLRRPAHPAANESDKPQDGTQD